VTGQAEEIERQRRVEIARGKQKAGTVERGQGDGYLTWQGQEEVRVRELNAARQLAEE
jgi:hypothetical protein